MIENTKKETTNGSADSWLHCITKWPR